jgi:hypothetical protein
MVVSESAPSESIRLNSSAPYPNNKVLAACLGFCPKPLKMLPQNRLPVSPGDSIHRALSKQQVTGNVFGFLPRNSEDIALESAPFGSRQRIYLEALSKQQVTGNVFEFLLRNSECCPRNRLPSESLQLNPSAPYPNNKVLAACLGFCPKPLKMLRQNRLPLSPCAQLIMAPAPSRQAARLVGVNRHKTHDGF